MMSPARATLFTVVLMTSAAAQTSGTPVETSPVLLSPEKQATVKQHVQREKPSEAQTGGPLTVGTIVPESVELWSLPQDSVSEVPTVTSYKFLLTGKTIAVVDPESRKVIQLLPN
jgi:hypothetical protein